MTPLSAARECGSGGRRAGLCAAPWLRGAGHPAGSPPGCLPSDSRFRRMLSLGGVPARAERVRLGPRAGCAAGPGEPRTRPAGGAPAAERGRGSPGEPPLQSGFGGSPAAELVRGSPGEPPLQSGFGRVPAAERVRAGLGSPRCRAGSGEPREPPLEGHGESGGTSRQPPGRNRHRRPPPPSPSPLLSQPPSPGPRPFTPQRNPSPAPAAPAPSPCPRRGRGVPADCGGGPPAGKGPGGQQPLEDKHTVPSGRCSFAVATKDRG